MKTRNIYALFFLSLFSLTLLGCGATNTREGTGEYIDDTVITTKVKAAILNTASLKVSEINVETYKGAVQLSGFVSSQDDINTAMRLARSITGVTSVKNSMQVK
ncbi:BON domain-containing protein [Rheinheimera maricola]|uniref:BON domain-containing protein n=1 Tax=Rheinheimera maricola TaxID=2793282 RepID=A0ABS7XCR7_9GAMM|nr:BON domain-containing protein [Rheinheimera maricola]MBZ9613338.1 BON domain-containing protein [Rheinheimera maricola]